MRGRLEKEGIGDPFAVPFPFVLTPPPLRPPILKRNNILKLYRKVANITTKNVLRNNFLLAPNEQIRQNVTKQD